MNKLVTILSFSSRNSGNCAKISTYISKYFDHCNQLTINRETVPSCGNCDYECLKPDLRCPQMSESYQELMDNICRSDLVYFVMPNYCGYPCANYFAFNERTVGYFNMEREKMDRYMNVPKRFIIVSNTEGFEDAMRQQTNEAPQILYLKSRKYGKRSTDGDILESDAAKADLDDFLSRTACEPVI